MQRTREELKEMISKLNYIEIDKQTKKEIEASILGLNDPEISYVFAKVVRYADIKAHAKIVIESKDPKYNYYFAKDIKGANIKEHAKVVIESKNPEWNYCFAKDIKGANVKAHQRVVLESENLDYIVKFTSIPGSFDVYSLEDFDCIIDRELNKKNSFIDDFNSKVKKLGEMKISN